MSCLPVFLIIPNSCWGCHDFVDNANVGTILLLDIPNWIMMLHTSKVDEKVICIHTSARKIVFRIHQGESVEKLTYLGQIKEIASIFYTERERGRKNGWGMLSNKLRCHKAMYSSDPQRKMSMSTCKRWLINLQPQKKYKKKLHRVRKKSMYCKCFCLRFYSFFTSTSFGKIVEIPLSPQPLLTIKRLFLASTQNTNATCKKALLKV